MLYIRMFIMLVVGLYTSRVVLLALGATDYGIYNIIGGVVVLFSFLSNSLVTATRRFLNFSLGKNNLEAVQKVFCMSMNLYIILSLIVLILAETIGLWFVEEKLNIPAERKIAAVWVYQFTIITFIINLLKIPYNASITAYEKMDFYAYISLIEVLLKFVVVYFLFTISYDKLIVYAFLYTLISLFVIFIYKFYCNRNFKTTHYIMIWDKEIFRQMFSFSGWSLFGSVANISAQQGLNILINLFHGVTANAAVGIANQVSSQVYQFSGSFQTAFHPQIVKSYAAKEMDAFQWIIFKSSKYSYYLMFFLALPIWMTTQTLFEIWLKEVPQYSVMFCQLILIVSIIECLATPLWMSVEATGEIKMYQILMASCVLLNFPLVFLFFKLGYPVYTAWIIRIIVHIITFIMRIIYMSFKLKFPVRLYLKKVILPISIVSLVSIPLPLFLTTCLDEGFGKFLTVVLACLLSIPIFIYWVGMEKMERQHIKSTIYNRIRKI